MRNVGRLLLSSEFDFDRMVSVRRSVLIEMEDRIKELEAALREIQKLITDMGDPAWSSLLKIAEIARKGLEGK